MEFRGRPGKRLVCILLSFLLVLAPCSHINAFRPVVTSLYGVYKYSLPCSDCPGVESTITIECTAPCKSGRYYQRDEPVNTLNGEGVQEKKGSWQVTNNGPGMDSTKIVLALTDSEKTWRTAYFLFTPEGNLEMLDKNKGQVSMAFRQVFMRQ